MSSETTTPAGGSCCGPAADARRATATEAPATGVCCGSAATTSDTTAVVAGRSEATDPPVVVIGAGPVGLAAAAHLTERGLPFLVLEDGSDVAASVRRWGHVRLFSPWRYNIDAAARRLLEAAGWAEPDLEALPTGGELVEEYLRPLAKLSALAPHIRYDAGVVAIGRVGVDRVRTAGREAAPFVVRLADGTDLHARAVIDASGTCTTPNVLGVNGLAAHGEADAAALIDYALPDVLGADRDAYAGRHTVVVGSGHSAANTLLALAELADQAPGTRITWAVRSGSADRAYGGGDADQLAARGALGTGLRLLVTSGRVELVTGFGVHTVRSLSDGHGELVDATGRTLVADRIVGATGFRPDHSIATELRLDLDPILGCTRALAPLIDPNEHSCGSVRPHGVDELTQPEPGYFAVGMKSYGRAPTFLMATGYEQVRSIGAALAGDWEAARDVQLELPETGVCSTTLGARAMLDDATARFGLAADAPAPGDRPQLVTVGGSGGGCCG
ncbi:NAD(P)-binding domain-containing protein [Planosporangium mesophilum]|uniref:Flavoprotein n=1 Tax=Planosporangium mesophilum TaxID=689768 RepID=A0A8J3TFY1_9ACTN|nr:NAD(P)-binding domain-containing protein [Planosporangium mesophilum]NJC86748.1 FAD-dependent oxidoreductase [Planosporangium mesophilum]GII26425.1 flavoprotein [Planosporangium mesophilum]